MKKGAIEIIRNLAIFLAIMVAFAFFLAISKDDLGNWFLYIKGVGAWLLISIVGIIVATILGVVIKGSVRMVKVWINRATGGKETFFGDKKQQIAEEKNRKATMIAQDKAVSDWIAKNFSLKKERMPEEIGVFTDSQDWLVGEHKGERIAIHDPNPYHFTIFLGNIEPPPLFSLRRIYPGEAMPNDCIELTGLFGESAELAKIFWLAGVPSEPSLAGKVMLHPRIIETLMKLSKQVYLVSVYGKGVELRMAKKDVVADEIGRDVERGMSLMEG